MSQTLLNVGTTVTIRGESGFFVVIQARVDMSQGPYYVLKSLTNGAVTTALAAELIALTIQS